MEKVNDLVLFSDIKFLNPQNAVFSKTEGGFLQLEHDGETFGKVALHRALPFTDSDRYISVLNGESKEIGIIKDIFEFSEIQAELILNELALRYYSPEITGVLSVKEKMGYLYFKVSSNAGVKYFAVKDVSKNIRRIGPERVLIFDVDGNRYNVKSIKNLDSASLKRLSIYFF